MGHMLPVTLDSIIEIVAFAVAAKFRDDRTGFKFAGSSMD